MKRLNVFLLLLLCLLFTELKCSSGIFYPLIRERKLKKSAPIQAHRGGGLDLPENTLETLIATWEKGIVPEVDLRTTKDGVIILLHDKTVQRVAPDAPDELKTVPVEQLTYAELSNLDVGAYRDKPGERIPTLAAVFAFLAEHPSYLLFLDCKKVNLDQLVSLIKHYRVSKQVIFTSSNYAAIRRVKMKMPRLTTMLWINNIEKIKTVRRAKFKGLNFLQVHYIIQANDSPSFSEEELRQLNRELARRHVIFQVLVWDTDDPEVYRLLYKIGIKSIATDYPDIVLKIMRELDENE